MLVFPYQSNAQSSAGALAAFAFDPLLGASTPTYGQWTHIQGSGAASAVTGTTTLSASLAAEVKAGHLVVVGVTNYNAGTHTVTDSIGGNTWTKDVTIGSGSVQSIIFHSVITNGGTSFTVTVTSTSSGYPAMSIDEYASQSGTILSVDSTGSKTSAGTIATTSALTVSGNDLVYAVGCNSTTGVTAPGAGFTARYAAAEASGITIGILAEDWLSETATPSTPAMTFAGSGGWSMTSVAFLAQFPPTTVVPYVGKSGGLVYFFAESAAGALQNVTAVAGTPTIWVQFGGVGSPQAVETWGPLWLPATQSVPFAAWRVACGPVASIVVQNGGSGYSSSPVATVTGGGGSGCALGTPVVTGGITSYTVTNGGSGYTSAPTVTVSGSGGGFGAEAVVTLTGEAVTGLTVFVPGYGYSGTITVSITGGGGSGATATAVATNVVQSIPVLTAGSGYTSQPTVTITDSTGSGASAAAIMGGIQPSDVVTCGSVSNGWMTSQVGIAGAVSTMAVANYAGSLEPGIGGISGFAAASINSLKLGFNVSDPHAVEYSTYNAHVNWLKRAVLYSGTATLAQNNSPLTINGTAGSPTYFLIADPTANEMDASNFPVAAGTWTLIADDTSGAAPMSATMRSIYGNASVAATYTPGTAATGITSISLTAGGSGYTDVPTVTITGGGGTGATAYALIGNGTVQAVYLTAVGTGYTGSPTVTIAGGNGSGATATVTTGSVISGSAWQFVVTRISSANTDMGLEVGFWNAAKTGTYAYSLVGEFLFSPASSAAAAPGLPSRANPLAPDQSLPTWMTTKKGNGPSVLRYVDSVFSWGGANNIVEAEDLKSPYDWTWGQRANLTGSALTADPTANRQITVSTVRTYALAASGYPAGWDVTWSSPNIYTNQWGTANASWPGTYIGTQGGPFYLTPTNVGFLNFSGVGSEWYVGEAVTSAPHGLKTGQTLLYVSGSSTFTISTNGTGGGTQSIPINSIGALPIYVTGPSSFAFTAFNSHVGAATGMPGTINNVAGSYSVTGVFQVNVPDLHTIPYEVSAAITASFPGCAHWVNIPQSATDACCQAIARRIRDNLPPGRRVYVEYSNENWNSAFTSLLFTSAMGQLGAWATGPIGADQSYTARAAQHHATFKSVFNQPDINGNTNRGVEIVNLFCGQFSNSTIASDIITYANANSIPVDALAIAPYANIYDQPYPQPVAPASIAVATGTTGLAAGTYYVSYTWVDATSGFETTVGTSQGTFTLTSGQAPTVTVTFPPSIASQYSGSNTTPYSATANIYLTAAGGASGTETLYATGIKSSGNPVLLASASWTNETTTQAAAVAPPAISQVPNNELAAAAVASYWPTSLSYRSTLPWSMPMWIELCRHQIKYTTTIFQGYTAANLAVIKNYTGSASIPALVGYEGGLSDVMPVVETGPDPLGHYLRAQLTHDGYYSPAIYDLDTAVYEAIQQAGFSLVPVYELAAGFNSAGTPETTAVELWGNVVWSGQPFGRGDGSTASNGQSITNQFWAGTEVSQHLVNAAVRQQAWRDWVDVSNPFPPLGWSTVRERPTSRWQRFRRGQARFSIGTPAPLTQPPLAPIMIRSLAPRFQRGRVQLPSAAPGLLPQVIASTAVPRRWFPGLSRFPRSR